MMLMRLRAVSVVQVLCVLLTLFPFDFQICADAAGIEDAKTEIVGTSGNDSIQSGQPVNVASILETTADEDVTTAATGVDGLAGDDHIAVTANMTAGASSKIDVPFVPLKVVGTTSESSTKGVRGGDGADLLLNLDSILSSSTSYTKIVEVISQIDVGVTAFPTEAVADSVGIEGGAGPDFIENNGILDANAVSDTMVVEARISAVEVPLDTYHFAAGETAATATAIGIDGDTQTDPAPVLSGLTEIITNHGSLSAVSDATSTTAQGMVELVGAARVDDSTTANAYSAGILGGAHNNLIINYQSVYSEAVSSADMTSVELKMKGLMLKPAFDLFGYDVGTFQTVADSSAVGVAGNASNDTIINAGLAGAGMIEAYGRAEADSQIFTFSVSPPLDGGTQTAGALVAGSVALPALAAAPTSDDTSAGAYGDASTVATSNAAGILGGAGDDEIANDVALISDAEYGHMSYRAGVVLFIDLGWGFAPI